MGEKSYKLAKGSISAERTPNMSSMNKALNKTFDFPLKKNESLHNFLVSAGTDQEVELINAAKLMKYLVDRGVDIRILNNIRVEFLKKDKEEKGELSVDDFIKMFRTISKQESDEVEKKIIEYLKVFYLS